MNIGDVMDEIAERLRQAPSLVGKRTSAYPPPTISAPAAIVSYPTGYTFDATYGRGLDRMSLPVVVCVGNPTERSTRDQITKYMNGAGSESVKALLDGDGDTYTTCELVHVASCEIDVYTIGGTEYLTAVFTLDIAGQGA